MRQLVAFTWTLYGRSGASDGIVLPVSHREIESFNGLMDAGLEPHEVEAIVEMDRAIRRANTPEPIKANG